MTAARKTSRGERQELDIGQGGDGRRSRNVAKERDLPEFGADALAPDDGTVDRDFYLATRRGRAGDDD